MAYRFVMAGQAARHTREARRLATLVPGGVERANALTDVTLQEPTVLVAETRELTTPAMLAMRARAAAPFTVLPIELAAPLLARHAEAVPQPAAGLVYDELHGHAQLCDAPAAGRLSLVAANQMLLGGAPLAWAYLSCHGEGGHLRLQDLVVCGLIGDVEVTPAGVPIAGGCRRGDCRRCTSGPLLPAGALQVGHLVVSTCNGISLAAEGFPSTSSVALAALQSRVSLVTSACAPVHIDAVASSVLGQFGADLHWWQREAVLNAVSKQLLGLDPFVTLGLPPDIATGPAVPDVLPVDVAENIDLGCRLYIASRRALRRESLRRVRARRAKCAGNRNASLTWLAPGEAGAGELESALSSLLGPLWFRPTVRRCERCGCRLLEHRVAAALPGFRRLVQALCPVCGVTASELHGTRLHRAATTFRTPVLLRRRGRDWAWTATELSLKAGAGGIVWRVRGGKAARVRPRWPTHARAELDTVRSVLLQVGRVRIERLRVLWMSDA